jgi:hypothetical protein
MWNVNRVVVASPALDDDLGLAQGVEEEKWAVNAAELLWAVCGV